MEITLADQKRTRYHRSRRRGRVVEGAPLLREILLHLYNFWCSLSSPSCHTTWFKYHLIVRDEHKISGY